MQNAVHRQLGAVLHSHTFVYIRCEGPGLSGWFACPSMLGPFPGSHADPYTSSRNRIAQSVMRQSQPASIPCVVSPLTTSSHYNLSVTPAKICSSR